MRYLLALLMLATGCVTPAPLDAPTPCPEPPPAVPATAPVTATLPLPAIKVWVDPGMRPGLVPYVHEGVDAWAQVFRAVRPFEYVATEAEAHVAIMEIGPYGGTCEPGNPDKTHVLGCVHQTGGLWDNRSGEPMPLYLIRGNVDRAPKLVVMHELGHLFGLGHTDGGLMWGPAPEPVLNAQWECPDAASVDYLAERFEIPGPLHACEVPAEVAAL